jgi:hypothetical protein
LQFRSALRASVEPVLSDPAQSFERVFAGYVFRTAEEVRQIYIS